MKRLLKLGVVTATLMMASAVPAFAQIEDTVDLEALNVFVMTLYLVVATGLVFMMHAGFSMLEAGLSRQKNVANIIGKNLLTITLGIVTYYAVGWAVMYGDLVGGFIGTSGFFLSDATGGAGELITTEIDFAFQAMFAATAATIVSGAVAERIKFGSYLVVVVALTALIYPVVGAWQWGGGWLDELGFYDFAGSTIVHLTGGVAAFVGAAILGPRLGKYGKDGKPRAIPGHNIAFVSLGTLLLFFGWFGFNGGSVLELDGPLLGHVIVTTSLAGAGGGLAAAFYTRLKNGKFDVAMTANGILAGLVGVTAGPDVISHLMALLVGLIAGVLVAVSVAAIDRAGIDDVVGAASVHGVCGVLGTLWVGLAHVEDGLFYGGGAAQLGYQAVGVVATIAWVGITTGVLFTALKAAGFLRVPEQEEIEGLDVHEHGVPGYPELVYGAGSSSSGYVPGAAAAPAPRTAATSD
ncbi:ammonium transporter [Nitriliruptor alkaliphilus]|uniref:ammonium transporter n=1 Tax=Nitriliruptor alkaliphilus TaxID=427918 RepID=UPI000AA0793E|nr:ammonium transporter [Nitriliruptor alkaliphilus]